MKKTCPLCGTKLDDFGFHAFPFMTSERICEKCYTELADPLLLFITGLLIEKPHPAVLFTVEGKIQFITPKNKCFTLLELQGLVDGNIEIHPERSFECLIVCDEEGLIKRKAKNRLFFDFSGITLVGDVLLCPKEIFEAPETDD